MEATSDLVARGVKPINVNMGCPFGRMTSVLAGGGMFSRPETVEPMLTQLRRLVPGSLSVKTRTGIDDERQSFDVLSAFENSGIDFVVVHSRTVEQKYKGRALFVSIMPQRTHRRAAFGAKTPWCTTPLEAACLLLRPNSHGSMCTGQAV